MGVVSEVTMKYLFGVLGLLAILNAASPSVWAQSTPEPSVPVAPATTPSAEQDPDRPVSWKTLLPNVGQDQKRIWLFPERLKKRKVLWPTLAVLGTAAALVALDPKDAPWFRNNTAFTGFNSAFSSSTTQWSTLAVPVILYSAGLVRKDRKMKNTAILAGEAVGDAEILTTVLKDATNRTRPAAIGTGQNYSDTWFDSRGSFLRGDGSFPSGHTIAAFSIATVISRRYGNHKWVPYVAYGLAGAVGFSRITLSAHFISDVFMGAALGYSIGRFGVLHE
jgi:membrane-associated phospholipid phosphatase